MGTRKLHWSLPGNCNYPLLLIVLIVLFVMFSGWFQHLLWHSITGWWFHFFSFSPLPGGRFPFWRSYFSNGLVQPPTSINSTVWIVYLFHLMPHLRLETVFFVGYFWSDDGPTSCCTEDQSVVYLYRKKELGFNSDNNWAVIKTIVTFHYTGWLIGILVLAYYNPYMGVSKNRGTPKWMVYSGKPF